MKRISIFAGLLLLLSAIAAFSSATQNTGRFPGVLKNAKYVYVASYDGDQFNPSLLPEDRSAISAVQGQLQKSGKFVIVYRPRQADMVVMVQSRPSEDVLAVYDGHSWPHGDYLWRAMGRGGLQKNETPLVAQLLKGFDQVQ